MPQGRNPLSRPGKLSPHEAARRSWLLSDMPIRKRGPQGFGAASFCVSSERLGPGGGLGMSARRERRMPRGQACPGFVSLRTFGWSSETGRPFRRILRVTYAVG